MYILIYTHEGELKSTITFRVLMIDACYWYWFWSRPAEPHQIYWVDGHCFNPHGSSWWDDDQWDDHPGTPASEKSQGLGTMQT